VAEIQDEQTLEIFMAFLDLYIARIKDRGEIKKILPLFEKLCYLDFERIRRLVFFKKNSKIFGDFFTGCIRG
jgi:hypothetical protein